MRLRANGEGARAGSYERSRPSPAMPPRWPPRAKTCVSLSGNGRESRAINRGSEPDQAIAHVRAVNLASAAPSALLLPRGAKGRVANQVDIFHQRRREVRRPGLTLGWRLPESLEVKTLRK